MSQQDLSIIHEEQHQNGTVRVSRKEANFLIPSIEAAYYGLIIKGYYLPKITSSIITSDYLLQVLFGKYFSLKAEAVSIGVLLKCVKKYEIINEITSIALENNQEWGIDSKHTPDKAWALNVLKSLKPNHTFFQKYGQLSSETKEFTQQQFNQIKELDTSYGKKSNSKRFFQIPKQLQEQTQSEKKQLKQIALQKKLQRKNNILKDQQEEIERLSQLMNQQA